MPRLVKALLASIALTWAGAAEVPAAETTPPRVAAGDYQAAPVLSADAAYDVGVFSVKRSAGRRQIVRSDEYSGIFYPDAGVCDDLVLPLGAESIPISATGRFQIRERTAAGGGFVLIDWRGHWTDAGIVGGSITIKHKGCTATHKWTGGKVG